VAAFEQVISRYPESPLVDDARYQIALASLKGSFRPGYDPAPTDLAIRELEAFVRAYPAGELADEARGRLAELKERRAQHEFQVAQFYEQRSRPASARIYYAAVVDEYAQSSWAPKAAARIEVLEQKL
jgi:outer membrane protein assembly factor BamD